MAAAAGLGLGLLGEVGSTVSQVQAADVNAKSLGGSILSMFTAWR